MKISLSTQEDFYKLADLWHNIFLDGVPGSWKTYAMHKWRDKKISEWRKIITVSFTWVAAVNAWWITIHKAFKIFWNEYRFINKQDIDWKNIDTLIIDECWTVSCDLLQHINNIIQKETKSVKPFWWIQVILIWDKKQIAPIYNLSNEQERKRFEELKWNVFFDNSNAFQKWNFTHIFLSENKRSDNVKYNELLLRIREWDMTAVSEFKKWDDENLLHLMAYNTEVDTYNNKMINDLSWKEYLIEWFIKWDFNLAHTLTPKDLVLKIWARVMVTANVFWMVNWDTWTVYSISDDEIKIFSDRLNKVVSIYKHTFSNVIFKHNWDMVIKWSFIQFPLRLAYAITINKSQWLTIDKYVFKYHPSLHPSFVYVALSRWISYDSVLIC